MKKIITLILTILFIPSCFLIERLALKNCEFYLVGVDVKEITLSDIKLGIRIKIVNPNNVDVVVDRMRADLYVNDQELTNANTTLKTKIPAGTSKTVEPVVSVDYSDVGAALLSVIKSGQARYKVVGTMYVDTPLGTLDIPVTLVEDEL